MHISKPGEIDDAADFIGDKNAFMNDAERAIWWQGPHSPFPLLYYFGVLDPSEVLEKPRWRLCKCPFHEDHHASMIVDGAIGSWECYSCLVRGEFWFYWAFMSRDPKFRELVERAARDSDVNLLQYLPPKE